MLSILCSTLWGQAGGFSVGVFVGGLMMNSKHNYKREDVKEDKLKKWYLKNLKEKKYPLIEEEANRAKKVIIAAANGAPQTTLEQLVTYTAELKNNLARDIITADNLRYFVSSTFRNSGITVPTSAGLTITRNDYEKIYGTLIGSIDLTAQDPETYVYTSASGIYRDATIETTTQRKLALEKLTSVTTTGGGKALQDLLKTTLGDTAQEVVHLGTTAATFEGDQTDANRTALNTVGKAAVKAYVNKTVLLSFLNRLKGNIEISSEWLDDPLEKALKAYQDDQAKEPTADEYDPDNTGKALTAPELGKQPGEQGNWETLEGEVKSKRIGLTYGFSVGYEKEMNKNHAFVGGNAFAARNTMKVKYNLEVNKGNRPSFGELEESQGYTFGVTVIAGKHLNPVFSVFGRGTFEFTKYGFTYNLTNDSPSLMDEKLRTQKLGNWVKQAAVGVGARYNFAPLWSAEICYDFLPATKTTVRDFNKLGDDNRRRGYIYTASQHRAFLKVVRFFNM